MQLPPGSQSTRHARPAEPVPHAQQLGSRSSSSAPVVVQKQLQQQQQRVGPVTLAVDSNSRVEAWLSRLKTRVVAPKDGSVDPSRLPLSSLARVWSWVCAATKQPLLPGLTPWSQP